LMMKAANTSEVLVNYYHNVQSSNPEGSHLVLFNCVTYEAVST
jgi:hypothetical protein